MSAIIHSAVYATLYFVGFTVCWSNGLALGARYGARRAGRIAVGSRTL